MSSLTTPATATATSVAFSLVKCSVNAMIIAFPAFQTFRVLEGRRIQDAHHMLTYWCVQCAINAIQNIADEMLGKYQMDGSYQTLCLLLKLAPIILGPEKLYKMFVKPFFLKQEKTLDIVTNTAEREADHAKHTLKQQGPLTEKIAHEMSHLKHSLKHAAKELIDRDATRPPSSSVDPTQVSDAIIPESSNLTAQALSRWEQSRDDNSQNNDSCCSHAPYDPTEPVTRCDLTHPYLPKIHEDEQEWDEKEMDDEIKHQPIVRQRH